MRGSSKSTRSRHSDPEFVEGEEPLYFAQSRVPPSFALLAKGGLSSGARPSSVSDHACPGMMNPRNMVAAHRLPHHRRNPRAKRTLQVLKLVNRNLGITRRLQRRDVFERSSIRLRHRSLRTSRHSQHKSQHHPESLHNATHSSVRPAPREGFAITVAFFDCHSAAKRRNLLLSLPLQLPSGQPIRSNQAQSNFQSTTSLLTPTIKLTQAQTVRRKPDCTI
jgi:hypothetical protein